MERERDSASSQASGEEAAADCILLGACGPSEVLPQNPELPADIFTACLTTPVRVCLVPAGVQHAQIWSSCTVWEDLTHVHGTAVMFSSRVAPHKMLTPDQCAISGATCMCGLGKLCMQ